MRQKTLPGRTFVPGGRPLAVLAGKWSDASGTLSLSAVHAAIMAGVCVWGAGGGGEVLESVPVETGGDVAYVLHSQLVTNNDTVCVRH